MAWEYEKMPIKSAASVVLSAEDKRAAAVELRARDSHGHSFHVLVDRVADRYSVGQYLVDPCRFSWSKSVRILGIVLRFVSKLKAARHGGGGQLETAFGGEPLPTAGEQSPCTASGDVEVPVRQAAAVILTEEEKGEAEMYFSGEPRLK